jgi:hypothetical protein
VALIANLNTVQAQTLKPEEKQMLAAIKRGDIRVTPELIEMQRSLHPELRGLSNQEIQKLIESKANGNDLRIKVGHAKNCSAGKLNFESLLTRVTSLLSFLHIYRLISETGGDFSALRYSPQQAGPD